MNQPVSSEHIVLAPGEDKVKYAEDSKMPNAGTFTVLREDHTLGNITRQYVLSLLRSSFLTLFVFLLLRFHLQLCVDMVFPMQCSPEGWTCCFCRLSNCSSLYSRSGDQGLQFFFFPPCFSLASFSNSANVLILLVFLLLTHDVFPPRFVRIRVRHQMSFCLTLSAIFLRNWIRWRNRFRMKWKESMIINARSKVNGVGSDVWLQTLDLGNSSRLYAMLPCSVGY